MNEAGTVVNQPMPIAWRFRMASAFSVSEPKLLVPRSSSFMPLTFRSHSHPSARLVLPRGGRPTAFPLRSLRVLTPLSAVTASCQTFG